MRGGILDFPDHRQETDHSCVAAVARSLMHYFGRGDEGEAFYRKQLRMSEEGTSPSELWEWLIASGFRTVATSGMALRELEHWTTQGSPVVCFMQWHGADPERRLRLEAGHCVAVVGVRGGCVHYQDPLDGPSWLHDVDFLSFWQDCDVRGQKWWRHGIAVSVERPAGCPH